MAQQTFEQWRDTNQIPDQVKRIVNAVLKECGYHEAFDFEYQEEGESNEEVITLRNRGGYAYGYGKGFSMSYRTSSMEDGPDTDPEYIIDFIKGIGFTIENSYGDNGMDSSTNYRDTWWNYEFLYKPSVKYTECFE